MVFIKFQIAELKRINNIHRDNEIFARRTIKIPMKIFTNNLVDVHTRSSKFFKQADPCTSSTTVTASINTNVAISDFSYVPVQKSTSEAISSAVCGSKNRTVLEDEDVNNLGENCSASSLLIQKESKPGEKSSVYNCNGADWGISWLQLLICSLLLGFAGPILYVIYITEGSKKGQ